MTDKQFDAYNRQLLERIQEVADLIKKNDTEKAMQEVEKIVASLQKSLED